MRADGCAAGRGGTGFRPGLEVARFLVKVDHKVVGFEELVRGVVDDRGDLGELGLGELGRAVAAVVVECDGVGRGAVDGVVVECEREDGVGRGAVATRWWRAIAARRPRSPETSPSGDVRARLVTFSRGGGFGGGRGGGSCGHRRGPRLFE